MITFQLFPRCFPAKSHPTTRPHRSYPALPGVTRPCFARTPWGCSVAAKAPCATLRSNCYLATEGDHGMLRDVGMAPGSAARKSIFSGRRHWCTPWSFCLVLFSLGSLEIPPPRECHDKDLEDHRNTAAQVPRLLILRLELVFDRLTLRNHESIALPSCVANFM